jgi:serine/threonine protein kinase
VLGKLQAGKLTGRAFELNKNLRLCAVRTIRYSGVTAFSRTRLSLLDVPPLLSSWSTQMETSANLQPSVRPGFRVHERYRVIRVIGAGGMGAVYEAVDDRLGSRVALKESYAQDSELKRQFEREARLLAGLKHPALPKVTDYFIEDDRAFLVMEYFEGSSLAEVITKQAPLPAQRVIAWADQVLDVLIYLHDHDRGIVHRDIKPHNLRVTANGVISLLDFGLAKVTQPAPASTDPDAPSVHGYTRWYSPIEQIQNSGTNERSDIYALGATLYHLLTGVRPDDAEKRARLIAVKGVDCLPRVDALVPAVGEDLGSIIGRAMALRSDDRYQTAEEFREALRRLGRVGNTVNVEDAPAAPRAKTYASPRRRFVQLTTVVAILIFATVLAAHFLQTHTVVEGPGLQTVATNVVSSSQNAPRQKLTTAAPKAKSAPVIALPQASVAQHRDVRSNVPVTLKPKPQKALETRSQPSSADRRPTVTATRSKAPAPAVKPRQPAVAARDNDSPQVLRAPDGTEVMKFKDGRIRVLSARDHGGQR